MTNFFAMIFCIICAIYVGFQGDVEWCLIDCGCALLNLPFALKWLKDYIKN